jgi:hypothetical protein
MVNRTKHQKIFTLVIMWILFNAGAALAQATAFTYQGKLIDNGNPAGANYDLTFRLFDTATVGSGVQQGATLSLTNVAVAAGIFTVQLDFGACASCFNGANRFLEISVKPTSGSTFTTLSPRQQITSTPYTIKSLSAATADGLSVTCVSCVTSSQIQSVQGSQVTGNISGTQINGAIPVASVPAGSASYIQNTTMTQANSNFNVSGNGVVVGNMGIGITTPLYKLHVIGQAIRVESPDVSTAPRFSLNFIGGGVNEKKWQNYAAGASLNFTALNDAENAETTWLRVIRGTGTSINTLSFPNGNVSIGTFFNDFKLRVEDPGSAGLRVGTSTPGGTVASFGPFGRFEIDKPNVAGGRFLIRENGDFLFNTNEVVITGGNVGIGTILPSNKLEVVNGFTKLQRDTGGVVQVCFNNLLRISECSSSRRYKTNIADWHSGLNLINRLRPVAFDWKESKMHDLGLIAEEVFDVEPLLVTYNDKGEIEGVKYDRIGVVLINAIREQQAQIEALQKENGEIKARLAALELLVRKSRNQQ